SSASEARQHDQPAQAGAIRANAGALFLPLAVAHLVFNISVLLKWFAPGLPTMVIALMLATAAILGVAPRRAGKTGATA
ncbi:hypothetical protein WB388_35610, partial [Streptomyces brasiliscabiei]